MINDISTWNYVRRNRNFDKKLEYNMIVEEIQEFYEAETDVDMADALADIIFVAVGSLYKLTGDSFKAESIMAAVLKANYEKGAKKDMNGKTVKPSDFVGPEAKIAEILDSRWASYLGKNGHIYED